MSFYIQYYEIIPLGWIQPSQDAYLSYEESRICHDIVSKK